MLGKVEGRRRRGRQRMRWLDGITDSGHGFGWTPAVGDGQGGLACCSPWGRKASDTTERLHFHFHALEKGMAIHSSVLAWRIPGTGKPDGLPSMGSHRVGND